MSCKVLPFGIESLPFCSIKPTRKLEKPSSSWSNALEQFISKPDFRSDLCSKLPFHDDKEKWWLTQLEAICLWNLCYCYIVIDCDANVFQSVKVIRGGGGFHDIILGRNSKIQTIESAERKPNPVKAVKNESIYVYPLDSHGHEALFASLKERFNYASSDCAASILQSPKKSSFPSSILNGNKDQYMLIPCKTIQVNEASQDIIIELCQDIQIKHLVFANLEYFSSMVRKFKLYVNNRYPSDSKHPWNWVGSFETMNERESQVFNVTWHKSFSRYMKLKLESFYGNEAYCPITLLKVYGITMMEDYMEFEEKQDSKYNQKPKPQYNSNNQISQYCGSGNPFLCAHESSSLMRRDEFPWLPTADDWTRFVISQNLEFEHFDDKDDSSSNNNVFKKILKKLNQLHSNVSALSLQVKYQRKLIQNMQQGIFERLEKDDDALVLRIKKLVKGFNEPFLKRLLAAEKNLESKMITDQNVLTDFSYFSLHVRVLEIVLIIYFFIRFLRKVLRFMKSDFSSAKTFLPIVTGPQKDPVGSSSKVAENKTGNNVPFKDLQYSFQDDPNYEANYGEKKVIRDISSGHLNLDDIDSQPKRFSESRLSNYEPMHFVLNDDQFQTLIKQIGNNNIDSPEFEQQPLQLTPSESVTSETGNFNLPISAIVFHSPKKIASEPTIPSNRSKNLSDKKKNQ